MRVKSVLLTAVLLFAASAGSGVVLSDYLPAGVSYDPAVPPPSVVLGHEVGEWHVRPDQLLRYAENLAAVSPRLRLEQQGRTWEGRPQPLLLFTSPENQRRLDELRRRHLALAEPGRPTPRDDELATQPLIIWLGYSIHGNEASGSNAALLVAYHLAAAQGTAIDELLERTVVLVDPSLNPDGLARFAHWANMHRGQVLVGDPDHREHLEAWPGGRTNHYWFDLNRDWILLQHPETRHRVATLQRWRPHLVGDYHEMGSDSTFFFQPGVLRRKHPLIPAGNVELTSAIADFHARTFDRERRLYYSEEGYDDFYPGKTAAYPDFNGGVAFLFEQASARGHLQNTDNGPLAFPFAVKNQFLASLSMLDGAVAHRRDLLAYQAEYYRTAIVEAHVDPRQAWVYGADDDPARTSQLDEILLAHQIELYRLGERLTVGDQSFDPAWARIVPVEQPQYRLLQVLFETRTEFADPIFYDVSTWTLPLAFGLPYASLGKRELRTELIGEALTATPPASRAWARHDPAFAYLLRWTDYNAPRALARLLAAGAVARVATAAFTAATERGDTRFEPGTIVLPVGLQPTTLELAALLERAAVDDGVEVLAVPSGRTPEGSDLGSSSLRPLRAPRPLLVVGDGVSAYEAGQVWHHLDARLGVGLALIEGERFASLDLDAYTHVLLVSMASGNAALAERGLDNLRRFVRAGGTLIAIKDASRWAATALLERAPAEAKEETAPALERLAYADYEEERAKQLVRGSIVAVELDLTHPLAYGYASPELPVFRNSTLVLTASPNPFDNVAHYRAKPLLSGFLSSENADRLAGAPAVMATRLGRGIVVLLLDDPLFRGYWLGTSRLLANALFFGPTVKPTSAPSSWR